MEMGGVGFQGKILEIISSLRASCSCASDCKASFPPTDHFLENVGGIVKMFGLIG